MRPIPIILGLLLLASCELVREVDIPALPTRLVVNGLFRPDSTWTIAVSLSRHILQTDPTMPPLNTVVTITRDDGEIFTLDTIGVSMDGIWFKSAERAEAGRRYTVRVSAPGFEEVHASAMAPTVVELVDVRLDSANMVPFSYNTPGSIPVEFTFRDPAGTADYYLPKFFIRVQRHFRNPDGTYTERTVWNPCFLTEAVESGEFSNLNGPVESFDDKGFDGKLRTVRLNVNKTFWSSNEPKTYSWMMELVHVTEDYYNYQRSVALQQEVDGNPFAQPVQVFSNIEGGYGLFAGAAASRWIHND
jgi:hypothetical protein